MKFTNLYNELKRRDVFRVATAYVVSSWLIIQVVVSIFPYIGVDDFWITVIIAILAIGFPIAIIVGWLYEPTPEGLRKTDEVDVSEEFEEISERKLNRIIITILSTVIIFMIVERLFFAESALIERDTLSAYQASIAVLPFVDMSQAQDQEYFSDGLSEELLNVLAKVKALKVAGRTSSFQFKGQNGDLTEIGSALNVSYILEGSVRKSGERLRITAQLISVEDGYHLWSETYDRELTANDIFDIQEEISMEVTRELKIQLLPQEEEAISTQLTTDIEAYNLFLEASQLLIKLNADDTQKAIDKFNQAIKLDPNFAEAYARLAIAYINLNEYGNISLEEARTFARENIDKALLLNGNLGRAFEALGYFNLMNYDDESALEAFRRASELLPNDPAVFDGLHLALEYLGFYDEANESLGKAYEQDPLNPTYGSSYANHLVYAGVEFEKANEVFDRMLVTNPDYTLTYLYKSDMLRDTPFGEIDEAFKIVYDGLQKYPDDLVLLRTLNTLSRELDFMEFAGYIENKIGELYPENDEYIWARINNSYQLGDFKTAEKLVREVIERVGQESLDEHSMFLARILYVQEEYDSAFEIVEDQYPDYFSDSLVVNDANFRSLINLSFMLEKTGNEELAVDIAQNACEYADESVEYFADERNKSYYKWGVAECQIFNKEVEAALDTFENLYFDNNSKLNAPEYFVHGLEVQSMMENSEFLDLQARILNDIHSMRAEVIDFLKQQGDWQDSWEISE